MVLAELLKERYRQEGWEDGFAMGLGIAKGRRDRQEKAFCESVAEGRVIGREDAHADWEAWYERMQQAARAGEPFDEPPPTRNGRPRPWETDPVSRPSPSAPHTMPPQEEPPCR